jgi:Rps23 Pro-64 3,4-dihydroxylase Tpa1-like proline 4-hydroxylase
MFDDFNISQTIDITSIRASFKAKGRVDIQNFLAAGQADMLRTHLMERGDWTLVLNAGDQVYEIERSRFAEMTLEQREELDRRVIEAGRRGFQYRYEAVRVPDDDADRRKRNSLLDRFVRFMSSPTVLDFLSHITDNDRLEFADGQATSYSPGHFLTSHDDDVTGKGRHAAYVFGLTPGWRAEWGGLLMFHGNDGNIEDAFAPAMGALRLFAVPKLHSVSYVTPFAPEPRISVTGWLRSRTT